MTFNNTDCDRPGGGKTIVITGSTSGIGLGMAGAFLERGNNVVISGRSQANLEAALDELCRKYRIENILAVLCDVGDFNQVERLWDTAAGRFGKIDIWINNAGTGHAETMFWGYSPEVIDRVVSANITGAVNGMTVAARNMLGQGGGAIYNMEGLGSSGPMIKGLALYSASKAALSYLTTASAREARGTPLVIGGLRPGMVATKLIHDQYRDRPQDWERVKRIFNILSDRVESVAPWLVDRVLANHKNGARFEYMTTRKVLLRFAASPFNKRKIYD